MVGMHRHEQRDRNERQTDERTDPDQREAEPRVHREHHELAMREVHDIHHTVHERQADRDEREHEPGEEPGDEQLTEGAQCFHAGIGQMTGFTATSNGQTV